MDHLNIEQQINLKKGGAKLKTSLVSNFISVTVHLPRKNRKNLGVFLGNRPQFFCESNYFEPTSRSHSFPPSRCGGKRQINQANWS